MFKLVLLLTLLLVYPSAAQMMPARICGSHDLITSALKSSFQEQQTSIAIVSGGRLLEVYTSEGGKTWTLIVTDLKGTTCAILAGTDWFNKEFTEPRT